MRGAGPRGRAALLSPVDSSLTSWDPDTHAWGSLEDHSMILLAPPLRLFKAIVLLVKMTN